MSSAGVSARVARLPKPDVVVAIDRLDHVLRGIEADAHLADVIAQHIADAPR